MEFDNKNKTAYLTKFSPYQQLLRKKKNIVSTLNSIVPMLNSSEQYKRIGQEEIDNSEYNIWQTEYLEPSFGGDKFRTKLWISSVKRSSPISHNTSII